jgi:hypothetical protein
MHRTEVCVPDALLPSIEVPLDAAAVAAAELPVLCGAVWKLLGLLPTPLVPPALHAELTQACRTRGPFPRLGLHGLLHNAPSDI